ncbi:hypothetical protein POM88_018018 [Heracleum sosnowskyi]|uniref:Uncharacterized protein n=1 Tax=Heracleum sosnowskyi TaxID=360622 RepID=A0AAD8IQ96_9APIA|nr:hypothetical protein POM88_018018 [Heracleum sosnowskyi]
MYMYAAQLLHFLPERCIVFGNSNQTVEAAHDARLKCVAVASKHPVYELGAADLVVKRLDELSIVDLKNLADIDSPEFGEPELEMEFEHPCIWKEVGKQIILKFPRVEAPNGLNIKVSSYRDSDEILKCSIQGF